MKNYLFLVVVGTFTNKTLPYPKKKDYKKFSKSNKRKGLKKT